MMGMPITVELVGAAATPEAIDDVFAYFSYVDEKFSTYKDTSEISRINTGQLALAQAGVDMQIVFQLAEQTRQETDGYFDIARDGRWDPSGIVKGWAIHNAAARLRAGGLRDFYIDAGGDIQADGHNGQGRPWRVGIRSPFSMDEIVKVVALSDRGIATSGTYIRGQHIYDPHRQRPATSARALARPASPKLHASRAGGRSPQFRAGGRAQDVVGHASVPCRGATRAVPPSGHDPLAEIVSLSVIGPNIYDADRFATAAFAMGRAGIMFVARLAGFEGYMIDAHGQATYTSGFASYVLE
jgi:thiamine biosynthesis lipoprotein